MSENSKTLKQLLAEFDEIVSWFDGDNIDVEMAIQKFKEGSKMADQIKKQLGEAKNKIEIVKKADNKDE